MKRRRSLLIPVSVALAGCLVMASVAVFGALQDALPWLTPSGEAAVTVSTDAGPAARVVGRGTASDAETVVEKTVAGNVALYDTWGQGPTSSSVGSTSLGFGCDATDGLSPMVARTRTWSTDVASVEISARAYVAGAAGAALQGVVAAVNQCAPAWTVTPQIDLGTEALQIQSRQASLLLWRRGDVLMALTVRAGRQAGSITQHVEAIRHWDARLQKFLRPVCASATSPAEAIERSPYADRGAYRGLTVSEPVERPYSEMPLADDVSLAPVVRIPAPSVDLPDPGARPAPLNPAPTEGPDSLPAELLPPPAPLAPLKPDAVGSAERAVVDDEGPGCGWEFTGQAAPVFDDVRAQRQYKKRVRSEERRLTVAWKRWQRAKVAYYEAYEAYVEAADSFLTYANELSVVREAWTIISQARDAYFAALAQYDAAVEANVQWELDVAAAQLKFEQELLECATPPPPVSGAEAPLAPEVRDPLTCPPERPLILDEPTPEIPTMPTPSPEAQLPPHPFG